MDLDLPGQLLILWALGMNVVAGFAFVNLARGKTGFQSLASRSYNFFTVSVIAASVYLMYLILTQQFSVQYVYTYSDSTLPFMYTLSVFWAGQEGTYLLWLMMNALFGYLIIQHGGRSRHVAMVVMSIVNLFFLAILIKLSPFRLLPFMPVDGSGLNPLLQDPWMVIHPPVIFIGYSMAGIVFSLVMATLVTNNYANWVRRVFPWVAVTSVMLAAGNIMGGYWAYKTLGWGGYWAWDPVENSSFIPWLASLGLLHGLMIERRSGALRKTNLAVAATLFLLVIYGTFLTRSGVLADFSVHSFIDLGTNVYLVGFMLLFIFSTIVMLAIRAKSIGEVPLQYNFFGREFSLFAAMAILLLFVGVVLFWTSLPLITGALSTHPRAADGATYNGFALVFSILLLLFLTFFPSLGGSSFQSQRWRSRLLWSIGVAIVGGVGLLFVNAEHPISGAASIAMVLVGALMFLMKPGLWRLVLPAAGGFLVSVAVALFIGVREPLYIILPAMAVAAVIANLPTLFTRFSTSFSKSGAVLVHIGFGIMMVGVIGSSAFVTHEKVKINLGETASVYGLEIAYHGMKNDIEYPHNELLLTFDDGTGPVEGRPQLYYSPKLDGIMKRPHIERSLLHDLYFSPEQIQFPEDESGLLLRRDQTESVGDYQLTFRDFETGGHDQPESGFQVLAVIDVEYADTIVTLKPGQTIGVNDQGQQSVQKFPAMMPGEDSLTMTLESILANQGAVEIDIPGLTTSDQPPERLLMDISRHPLINLVWFGTTLIILGGLIVAYRRFTDLGR